MSNVIGEFKIKFDLNDNELFNYEGHSLLFESYELIQYSPRNTRKWFLPASLKLEIIADILLNPEKLIKQWKPAEDEWYYYLDFSKDKGYDAGNYQSWNDKDINRVKHGFIAQTKEEIIEIRDRILSVLN